MRKNIIDFYNDEEIGFDLFKIAKEDSKLNFTIFGFDSTAPSILNEEIPCIFIEDPDKTLNMLKVSISENPEILDGIFEKEYNLTEVFNFIRKNKEGLLKIWNSEDPDIYCAFDFYNEYLKDAK